MLHCPNYPWSKLIGRWLCNRIWKVKTSLVIRYMYVFILTFIFRTYHALGYKGLFHLQVLPLNNLLFTQNLWLNQSFVAARWNKKSKTGRRRKKQVNPSVVKPLILTISFLLYAWVKGLYVIWSLYFSDSLFQTVLIVLHV